MTSFASQLSSNNSSTNLTLSPYQFPTVQTANVTCPPLPPPSPGCAAWGLCTAGAVVGSVCRVPTLIDGVVATTGALVCDAVGAWRLEVAPRCRREPGDAAARAILVLALPVTLIVVICLVSCFWRSLDRRLRGMMREWQEGLSGPLRRRPQRTVIIPVHRILHNDTRINATMTSPFIVGITSSSDGIYGSLRDDDSLSRQGSISALTSDEVCSICFDARKDDALVCGHVICRRCRRKLRLCPFCRTPISGCRGRGGTM